MLNAARGWSRCWNADACWLWHLCGIRLHCSLLWEYVTFLPLASSTSELAFGSPFGFAGDLRSLLGCGWAARYCYRKFCFLGVFPSKHLLRGCVQYSVGGCPLLAHAMALLLCLDLEQAQPIQLVSLYLDIIDYCLSCSCAGSVGGGGDPAVPSLRHRTALVFRHILVNAVVCCWAHQPSSALLILTVVL